MSAFSRIKSITEILVLIPCQYRKEGLINLDKQMNDCYDQGQGHRVSAKLIKLTANLVTNLNVLRWWFETLWITKVRNTNLSDKHIHLSGAVGAWATTIDK